MSTAAQQVERLADWIIENVEGEPSPSEGAIDTAIRLLELWQNTAEAFEDVMGALSTALDGDDMYAERPAELVWKIRNQRDEALEEAQGSGWIAVTPETMPYGSFYVLAVFPDGQRQNILRAFWLSPELAAEPEWETEDGDPSRPGWYEVAWNTDEMWPLTPAPTHWRPLPSPPVQP